MKIPADSIIPPAKLTDYLLVERPWDDKSKFLAQADFRRDDPQSLEQAIRQLAANADAVEDGENEYGAFWRVEGDLCGPNGVRLTVVAIWLHWLADGKFHLVTLKPRKEKS